MADAEKLILIKRIMVDLEYVWTKNADLRLGQLMECLYGCGTCMFHREDDIIASVLKAARERGLVSGTGMEAEDDDDN